VLKLKTGSDPETRCPENPVPSLTDIYTTINFTRLTVVSVTVAAALAGWPVTVGVVEVGGVSQPGADAERYRRVLAG